MSQNRFSFQPLVDIGGLFTLSAALGADGTAPARFTEKEIGKPLKLEVASADSNYVLPAAGEEIEAFVESLEPFTVNQGFTFGTIRIRGRVWAKIGTDQGATPAKVGDYVVAGAAEAIGTGTGYGSVKTGAPSKYLWRIVGMKDGAGAAGTKVLLERL